MTPGAGQGGGAAAQDPDRAIREELRGLRDQVAGVHGSLVATSDGFMVAGDIPDLEPTRIAALVATTLGLARQSTQVTGRGLFQESLTRGSDGYLAVFAAGDKAVIAVLGDRELNVGMLYYQVRGLTKRITHHLEQAAQSRRFLAPPPPEVR